MAKITSTALDEADYSGGFNFLDGVGSLTIDFDNGPSYIYRDVPKDVYKGLLSAASKGSYFNQFIRNSYVGSPV